MSNKFMNGLSATNAFGYTENGAVKRTTSGAALYDMFALGAAYRSRSEADCVLLFKNAYMEDPAYALKCLFYIGDVREGQGERRFFRVCYRWLAMYDEDAARRNLKHIPEFKRWDDLIKICYNTSLWPEAVAIVRAQLAIDVESLMRGPKEAVSLLAKWMPSENASSRETCALANALRSALGWTHKQYRTILSRLRERSNVLERLMSAGRWDEIEFDAIPSKAGIKYKNAFARHDIERMKSEKDVQSYEDFAKDKNTTVNADVLNPVDIAEKIFNNRGYYNCRLTDIDRAMLDKYWANLKDYYHGREENGIAICDVSGSMVGQPLNAAVAMSAYIAERGKGPFQNHFITFSSNPKLVRFEGIDIADKFIRASNADWGMNTNIEAAMEMLLQVAIQNDVPADEVPSVLYIFSDMEFDACMTCGPAASGRYSSGINVKNPETLFETIAKRWKAHGYQLPRVVFWNLNARNNNIPAMNGRFSCVSGFNMNMVETILSGKDGVSLMYEKLDSERYAVIG